MPEDVPADTATVVWLKIRDLLAAGDVVKNEHDFLRSVGLTAGPVRALRALLDGGPQAMKALADRLGCDKSYVTSLVKPLVSADLADLKADPADGRVKVVRLTAQGRRIARQAAAAYAQPPQALAALSTQSLERLAHDLPATDQT